MKGGQKGRGVRLHCVKYFTNILFLCQFEPFSEHQDCRYSRQKILSEAVGRGAARRSLIEVGRHDPLFPRGVRQSLVKLRACLHLWQRCLHVSRLSKVFEESRDGAHGSSH